MSQEITSIARKKKEEEISKKRKEERKKMNLVDEVPRSLRPGRSTSL